MMRSVLTPQEELAFALRELFEEAGYRRFRVSKFEDYDLYSRYKDFLVSDAVISFTDTGGALKALKPDVTLSILKSSRPGNGTEKLYYNESVYRPSDGSFKELTQCGLECIGALDEASVLEVVSLAARSLEKISGDCVLSISQPEFIKQAADGLSLSGEQRDMIFKLVEEKNIPALKSALASSGADREASDRFAELAALSGDPASVIEELSSICPGEKTEKLRTLCEGLEGLGFKGVVSIDLSAGCRTRYYSGLVFKGYIKGTPSAVLAGGRYDALARRMGKDCGAIGFAVYLDAAERFLEGKAGNTESDGILKVALPKGRLGEKVYAMFAQAGYECPEAVSGSRKLIFENPEKGVSYFWVKPSDVAVYVERGAADIGVCGKDIIMEHVPDVYEILDLKTGKCRMAVAARKDFVDDPSKTITVATKFGKIAADYYASLGRDIDMIHLNGSIELAPLLGLSDVIVDIVETGTTLKENGLVEREKIADISARLISNKASYEFKGKRITALAEALGKQVNK